MPYTTCAREEGDSERRSMERDDTNPIHYSVVNVGSGSITLGRCMGG